MSSSPTDLPTSTPAKPLNVGLLLLVLAALWVVPVAWGGYKWYAPTKPTADSMAEKLDPDSPEAKALATVADVNRTNHIVMVIVGAFGGVAALVGALWWISSKPTMEAAQHERLGRILILLVGGFSGLLLMFGGVWFFIDQYELLSRWLTKKETKTKDLWKILVPALVFIVGAGAAFLAAQPAREEERHDQTTRRLVYGTNFLVTGVLVFLALVIVNGFVTLRLPNRLDTTQTGYYSISTSTEDYVKTLSEKVTVYHFGDTQRQGSAEAHTMLLSLQELNPSLFVYRNIGRTGNTAEIQSLRAKFTGVDFRDLALIVAIGENESRYSFIRESELTRQEQPTGDGPPQLFFEGESRFVRELLFLSEDKKKAIIYFTQGNGELAIAPAGGRPTPPDRSANELKAVLEKANLDVRPMPFDAKAPAIPADAAMVIVADPQIPLPKELTAALTRYMTEAQPGNKKGKLIVLSGPQANLKGDAVQPTGMEELLQGFGVRLVPAYLLNQPISEQQPPELLLVRANAELQASGHPVARSLPSAARNPFAFLNARPVEILPNNNPAFQAAALIETYGENLLSWQEEEPVRDSQKAMQQLQAMLKNNPRETFAKKKISPVAVPVAAVVSEGTTARLVAVGASEMFSDEAGRSIKRETATKLLIGSIDWLRDRPSVEIANKQFGFYTPQAKLDQMRLLFLPFGLSVLVIAGLAAGIWVIRRK